MKDKVKLNPLFPSPLLNYGLTFLIVTLAAFTATHILALEAGGRIFLFLFAVFQATFLFGHAPGLLAIALSLLILNALMWFQLDHYAWQDAILLNVFFCVASGMIIYITTSHRDCTLALWKNRHDLNHVQDILSRPKSSESED
jgi:K+-sensing histidine kinase KdpD